MRVYTVHEPPVRRPGALADPARFVFVRDGFYWWAFLLTPVWMLWRRLWLVFVLYLVLSIGIETAMRVFGASAGMTSLVAVLISLLVGFEASTLRRFTLKRRGWRNVGVVSGSDLEDAEHRFFAAWVNGVKPQTTTPPGAPPPAPSGTPLTTAMAAYMPPVSALTKTLTQPTDSSGVIGLFPEPGARR
jgi:Protein of unknown function (DUF2628)